MLNTKNIIPALLLLFSASSAFAAVVCDGSGGGAGATSVTGYLGKGEVFSYKTNGTTNASCDPASGCDGYVGFPVYQCNNFTTILTWVYVKTGSAHDNALVDLIYHLKSSGKKQTIMTLPANLWGGLQVKGAYPE